jgi:siderophore synthetase component
VRLRGREVDFAVTSGAAVEAAVAPTTTPTDVLEDTDEGGTARLSLRLPERLKPRVEQAAEAAGLSVNAWLVRSISTILDTTSLASAAPPTPGTIATGQRQTGWVR